jgi:polysaccharide export outer membrane protein
MKKRWLALLVALWGAGFGAGPLMAQGAQPIGRPADPALGGSDVLIRAGDLLRITVWPDSSLGGDFTVEETGQVHLPGIGMMQAAGMPLGTLRTQLRNAYARTIREPVVTVTTVFRVAALGEVARPGLYEVTPTNTIYDLIAMAGGFQERANLSRVRLMRDSRVVEVDASRGLDGTVMQTGLELRPGDQVVVPRRSALSGASVRDVLFVLQSVALAAALVDRLAR